MNTLRKLLREKWQEVLATGVVLPVIFMVVPTGNLGAIVATVVGSAVLLGLIFSVAERVETRKLLRGLPAIQQDAFAIPRRALVLTLSFHSHKPGSVAHLALSRLKPDYLVLLGTPETEAEGVHTRLIEMHGLNPDHTKMERWAPPEIEEGIAKTILAFQWLYRQGVSREEIVVDLTAGTAIASVAVYIAAERERIDCQYVHSVFDREKNAILEGSQRPLLIRQHPRTAAETTAPLPQGVQPAGAGGASG